MRILITTFVLFLSGVCAAQVKMNLEGKPRLESMKPTDTPTGSTNYTEAEEARYQAYVAAGYRLLMGDSLLQAMNNFQAATSLLPSHPANGEAYRVMGGIAECQNRPHLALEYYRKSLTINPKHIPSWERRAALYMLTNSYADALDAYDHLIQLKPDDAKAYFYRGYAQQMLSRPADALYNYNKVLELSPADQTAALAKAIVLEQLGRSDEAIEMISSLVNREPSKALYYAQRGQIELSHGQNELALYDFDKAIELEADNAAHYILRSITHSRLRHNGKARSDLNQARSLGATAAQIDEMRQRFGK